MGTNLIPKVDNFYIQTKEFPADDDSVTLKCIEQGKHRVLRFDLYCENIGDQDLVIGNPKDRPDIFIESKVFPWQFKENFYTYFLRNNAGLERKGYKVAFCLMGGPGFNCDNQGIAAGSQDVYGSALACQFVIIDNMADGEYVFEATANAASVDAVKNGRGNALIPEDNYDDNRVTVNLRITGDLVNKK